MPKEKKDLPPSQTERNSFCQIPMVQRFQQIERCTCNENLLPLRWGNPSAGQMLYQKL